jgi:hypothetical protein
MSSSRRLPPIPIQDMSSSRVLPPVLIHPGHYILLSSRMLVYLLIQYIGLLSSSRRLASCYFMFLSSMLTFCLPSRILLPVLIQDISLMSSSRILPPIPIQHMSSLRVLPPILVHPGHYFLFSSGMLASCPHLGH